MTCKRSLVASVALVSTLGMLAASPSRADDLVFVHHSVGSNWLSNSLHAALLAKDYIDRRNDVTYGTSLSPDPGRPASLGSVPGDSTNMNHWILWFNDYLQRLKVHGVTTAVNRIVMFKSCYPISNITSDGSEPGDPFSSSQTLANYMAVYRHPAGAGGTYVHGGISYKPLEDIFAENPDTLFVPVTAPPLAWTATTDAAARRARVFNTWLKETWLPAYRSRHPGLDNVAVFDLFDVLAYPDSDAAYADRLKGEYGGSTSDSHPNAAGSSAATQAFASGAGNALDSAWAAFSDATPARFTLTVARSGGGDGTVTSSPAGIGCGSDCAETFDAGSTVRLTPAPAAGSVFAGWTGDSDCRDGQIQLNETTTCTATFVTAAGAAGRPGILDLNGDGASDVLAYDPRTGSWLAQLNDGTGGFGASGGSWSPAWTVKAADFNSDLLTDLFFYNDNTGAWFKGFNIGGGAFRYVGGTWSPGWEITLLDLDGNGESDVFVYNPSTGAWYTCRHTIEDGFAYAGGTWSPGWEVHAAELNGDGFRDLFLHNKATGRWYRAVNNQLGGFAYQPGLWSPGWAITTGDFDADGLTDLFVYNAATGAWYECRNTGNDYTYAGGAWSAGWSLSVGDFSGDGQADVFLYNPLTGYWFVCRREGAGQYAYAGGRWSPGWEVHVTELNGDRLADLLVYDAATGQAYQCRTVATAEGFIYKAERWEPGRVLATLGPGLP